MAFISFSFLSSDLSAYNNRHAHIDINAYSFAKFRYDVSHDLSGKYAQFKNYDFDEDIIELEGYTVKDADMLEVEEKLVKGNYQFWVAMGGYTADEPELYSSLRHFYDPLMLQADSTIGQKVTYLTDHTSELLDTIGKAVISDPRMDAREWALTGPARRGYKENRYSLRRGVEYMRRAWAEKNVKMKERLFAAAWRSCGETMHLLADMTVPAHVRNDAHPWASVFSGLRYDPYEFYVTSNNANNGNVIKKYFEGKVDTGIAKEIDNSTTAAALFHQVALFTNQNFFSADTLSGTNQNGDRVRSANGMRDYPSPTLSRCKVDALGVYKDDRTGFSVAHADWAENTWWNLNNYLKQEFAPKLSASARAADSYEDVAMDQAKILLPVAVNANSKLLEMFMPEVEVKLTRFMEEDRVFIGELEHIVSGVYADPTLNPGKEPMVFSNCPDSYIRLTINNRPYSAAMNEYAVHMEDNVFAIAIDDKIDLSSKSENIVSMEIFLGGYWVKSNEFKFPGKTKSTNAKSINMSISGPIRFFDGKGRDYEEIFTADVKVTVEINAGGTVMMKEHDEYKGHAIAELVTDQEATVRIQITNAKMNGKARISGYELLRDKEGTQKMFSKNGAFSYQVGTDEDSGGSAVTVVLNVDGIDRRNDEEYVCSCEVFSHKKRPAWYEIIR